MRVKAEAKTEVAGPVEQAASDQHPLAHALGQLTAGRVALVGQVEGGEGVVDRLLQFGQRTRDQRRTDRVVVGADAVFGHDDR